MRNFLQEKVVRFFADHPRFLIVAVVLYLLSPLDVLPEALLGPLGYLDDLFMLLVPYLILRRPPSKKEPPDVVDTTIEP